MSKQSERGAFSRGMEHAYSVCKTYAFENQNHERAKAGRSLAALFESKAEMVKEGDLDNLVFGDTKAPELVKTTEHAAEGTTRLTSYSDSYEPYDGTFDFGEARDIDEIIRMLRFLRQLNLCLVGTRGYVYDTGALAIVAEELYKLYLDEQVLGFNVASLTRTCGLRSRFIDLCN